MNKFDKTLDKMELCKYATGSDYYIDIGDSEHYETIKAALTQAAEIERGDKVVVPREPTDAMLDAYNDVEPHSIEFSDEYFVYVSPVKQVKAYKAMITASEGKDDE